MNDAKPSKASTPGSVLRALAAKECLALEHALVQRKRRQDGIHEVRKSSRRLRSLLGFLKPLSDQRVLTLDKNLKQLARGFSPLRDAHVAARTARLLVTSHEVTLTSTLLAQFDEHSKALLENALEKDPDWHRRHVKARRIAKAFDGLPWQELTPDAIKKALKRNIRRTKKARELALEDRSVASYHRWRRRARQLRYQLEFLRKARRTLHMKKKRLQQYDSRIKRLSLLVDRLGWRQDFQVFLKMLEQLPNSTEAVALREKLRETSSVLSKASPTLPKSKPDRSFIAHGAHASA
jgi:CHAD domain-containing protein